MGTRCQHSPGTLPPGAWTADAKDPTKLSKRKKGLVQAMHKPSPCPGHSRKGDPVSDLINLVYGMATHRSLVAALGNNHLCEDNYGGRKENSSKVVSCRALDAARWVQPWQLPGCLQSMHAVLSCRVSAHLQAKDTVTLQELQTAQHRDRSTVCACPRTHPAALLPKEIAAQPFPALQGGCGSSLAPGPDSYCATMLYCSYWDGAPAATE